MFIRKKNIQSKIDKEKRKVRIELIKDHEREINRLRAEYVKAQDSFQKEMEFELKKKSQEVHLKYKLKIESLKSEIEELTNDVKFAQSFTRRFYKDADAIYNIATVLESKAMLSLENEKATFDKLMVEKAEGVKGISTEKHKIEMIFKRMNKYEDESQKLLGLLED